MVCTLRVPGIQSLGGAYLQLAHDQYHDTTYIRIEKDYFFWVKNRKRSLFKNYIYKYGEPL